ncbi:MAG: SpoIVB peptidase [Ruminococcaceae bacterium]|nr:SpoIVB peptidase [Oscillospiraceae bacterium]
MKMNCKALGGRTARTRRKLKTMCFLLLLTAAFSCILSSAAGSLPDEIYVSSSYVTSGKTVSFGANSCISIPASQVNAAGDDITENRSAYASLFGAVPLKRINVIISGERSVYLSGQPVGIAISADGIVIADTVDVATSAGPVNPGRIAGLSGGDIITSINGTAAGCAADLLNAVEDSSGNPLTLCIRGIDGSERNTMLTPVYSLTDCCYRAGIWVRDSTAGIGIMTFVDPETQVFGALGHAICDSDSGMIIPMTGGILTDAVLTGINRGTKGHPGELIGSLGSKQLGTLLLNDCTGVYGIFSGELSEKQLIPVAPKHEVREGAAQLLTTLPGHTRPELFDIVIEQINYDNSSPTRSMVIRVTDTRLLELTGGIVQGMSGSPIIQQDRLVAAVTHVFVNNPTKGYAIFSENMIINEHLFH